MCVRANVCVPFCVCVVLSVPLCVCVCVHICSSMCVRLSACACVPPCKVVCVCVSVCACIYLFFYVCVCVRLHACVCVCVCPSQCICTAIQRGRRGGHPLLTSQPLIPRVRGESRRGEERGESPCIRTARTAHIVPPARSMLTSATRPVSTATVLGGPGDRPAAVGWGGGRGTHSR